MHEIEESVAKTPFLAILDHESLAAAITSIKAKYRKLQRQLWKETAKRVSVGLLAVGAFALTGYAILKLRRSHN